MTIFPLVEQYRAEIRAMDFERLTGEQMVEIMRRHRNGVASNAIEGNHGDDQADALLSMLHEERVPPAIGRQFVLRHCRERWREEDILSKAG